MSNKVKGTILAVVIILIAAVLLLPHLGSRSEDPNQASNENGVSAPVPAAEGFHVTPNPLTAYNKAKDTGKPIFVEFYSNT